MVMSPTYALNSGNFRRGEVQRSNLRRHAIDSRRARCSELVRENQHLKGNEKTCCLSIRTTEKSYDYSFYVSVLFKRVAHSGTVSPTVLLF